MNRNFIGDGDDEGVWPMGVVDPDRMGCEGDKMGRR